MDDISHNYLHPNDPVENIRHILKRNRNIYNNIEEKKELATRLRDYCEMSVITCSRPLITRPRTSSLPSPILSYPLNDYSSSNSFTPISSNNDIDNNNNNNSNQDNSTTTNNNESLLDQQQTIFEKSKTPPIESTQHPMVYDYNYEFELSKSYRCEYLNDILSFVQKLNYISKILVNISIDKRQAKLKNEISLLNIKLPLGLYLPLWQSSFHHCIVRIPPEEVKILNSRERVPFLLVLEVIESDQEAKTNNIFEVVSSYLQYTTSASNNLQVMDQMKKKYFSYTIKKGLLSSSNSNLQPPSSNDSEIININNISNSTTTTTTNTTSNDISLSSTPSTSSPSNSSPLNKVVSPTTPSTTTTTPTANNNTNSLTNSISSPTVEKIIMDNSYNTSPFGESWEEKTQRYKRISPFGQFPNWRLCSVIVKTGDDCRQEQMAVQLIEKFAEIWKESKLPLFLRPYSILVTSSSSGIIETIPDTISLHNLKKNVPNFTTLLNYFKSTYGDINSLPFRTAQTNFIESMAAYCIVTYLLQVKDRHNGNILLDREGHIVHIDFGFILSNSPGNISFESAPFKLTQEWVDVMGGVNSSQFQYFKVLCIRGFVEARKQMDRIISLIEIMMSGPKMSCFVGGLECIEQLKSRFFLNATERECDGLVEGLITYSLDHFKTRYYDKYQSWYNGILP